MQSPIPVFTPAQVRERDRLAIEVHGVPGYELMTRAAAAALAVLRSRWPGAQRLLVLCGAGNNAGDGYVLARLAAQAGLATTVVPVFDPEALGGDAAQAFGDYRALVQSGRSRCVSFAAGLVEDCDVIVDALFGTGLSRAVEGRVAEVVRAVNAAAVPTLAIDVPSGLCAGTGAVLGHAVIADATVTFVGRKTGLYLGRGPDHAGAVFFDDLGTDALLGADAPGATARLLDPASLTQLLPPRRATSHKGSHGHVLIVAGGEGMSGAARLAAEAALYTGAGLVTVATAPAHAAWLNVGRPELMCRGVPDGARLEELLERADVVVAGPGLGTDGWAREMLAAVAAADGPRVLDADALNLIASGARGWPGTPGSRALEATVITPHPGEASRLLGTSTAEVQSDRLGTAVRLTEAFGVVSVLKGAGTLVATPAQLPAICDRGNPGMAAPGMGDVLSGVIGALLGQLADASAAASAGVLVHALAGDDAVTALGIERGLLASELLPCLRRRVNPVQAGPARR